MELTDLPAVNATLNGISTLLLGYGYYLIRHRRIQEHQRVMFAAFIVSVVFLMCYLIYHLNVGSVKFTKTGPIRTVYFGILITHVILAALVPFLALRTLYLAFRQRFTQHRRIARITWPIWMYVSVTGVIVYWMLYQL